MGWYVCGTVNWLATPALGRIRESTKVWHGECTRISPPSYESKEVCVQRGVDLDNAYTTVGGSGWNPWLFSVYDGNPKAIWIQLSHILAWGECLITVLTGITSPMCTYCGSSTDTVKCLDLVYPPNTACIHPPGPSLVYCALVPPLVAIASRQNNIWTLPLNPKIDPIPAKTSGCTPYKIWIQCVYL